MKPQLRAPSLEPIRPTSTRVSGSSLVPRGLRLSCAASTLASAGRGIRQLPMLAPTSRFSYDYRHDPFGGPLRSTRSRLDLRTDRGGRRAGRSPFYASTQSIESMTSSSRPSSRSSSVRPNVLPVNGGFSGYASRQSWCSQRPNGTGWFDAMGYPLQRKLRGADEFKERIAAAAAAATLHDATTINPWTPRMTHLHRPASVGSMLGSGLVRSMASSGGLSTSTSTGCCSAASSSSSASTLFSPESDGSPVWPYSWHRDGTTRGKYR